MKCSSTPKPTVIQQPRWKQHRKTGRRCAGSVAVSPTKDGGCTVTLRGELAEGIRSAAGRIGLAPNDLVIAVLFSALEAAKQGKSVVVRETPVIRAYRRAFEKREIPRLGGTFDEHVSRLIANAFEKSPEGRALLKGAAKRILRPVRMSKRKAPSWQSRSHLPAKMSGLDDRNKQR